MLSQHSQPPQLKMPWMLGIARNCEPHSTAFNKNSTWHLWNACCCDQRLHKSIQRWNACYAIRSLCFADLAQNGSRRVLFERNHPPKRLGFQASKSRNGSRWTMFSMYICSHWPFLNELPCHCQDMSRACLYCKSAAFDPLLSFGGPLTMNASPFECEHATTQKDEMRQK